MVQYVPASISPTYGPGGISQAIAEGFDEKLATDAIDCAKIVHHLVHFGTNNFVFAPDILDLLVR